MQQYILRRLFQSIFVAAAVLVMVFFVGHVIGDPVDAATAQMGERPHDKRQLGPRDAEKLAEDIPNP